MRIVIGCCQGLRLEGLREALALEGGFEVVAEGWSGEEVLPLVARTDPSVVLLDAQMLGMGGLGLLERLRERFPEVKVVVCGASADPDNIQAAFEQGASGYVVKNVGPFDLGSMIRLAVEGTAYISSCVPATRGERRTAGLSGRELGVVRARSRERSNNQSLAARARAFRPVAV